MKTLPDGTVVDERPKFRCPICTKPYWSKGPFEIHVQAKHKGYIPKSTRGLAFKMQQESWPLRIFSGRFESNRSKF